MTRPITRSSTRKNTTKPQMYTMVPAASRTAAIRAGTRGGRAGTEPGRSDGSAACRGRARAMTSAARICTPHSSTPARRLPKQPSPATPRINAGPQLLENSSRRQASRREMPPRRYSWATVRAPTG